MNLIKTTNRYQTISIYGIPFLLIFLSVLILKSNVFKENSNLLSFGITFDFVISIPFIYYLLIRKTKISTKSISILLTVNIILASFFIPKQNQYYLELFKNWLLPILELLIIGMLINNVKKSLKKINENETQNTDFFIILKQVLSELIPKKIVIPFATEIAVFYYGFINWKKRKLTENEFSYHKNSGIKTALIAFMISGMIEIFVIHKLLMRWNGTVAWVLTILSIYTAIQIYGIIRSLSKRPILINEKGIHLKYSIISETYIAFENINEIQIFTKEIDKKGAVKYFSPFGKLEGNNIKIELKKEITVIGLYGIKRKMKSFVLFIDEKEKFIQKINNALQ